ncbi:MAG: prolyl aminopeptidase [Alphaproteobacteria bacterium]|nr:prolyl aminopeptidase [Alphaproteobacteria bacterium]
MDAIRTPRDFYPRIEPFAQGLLDLDGLHHMFWEQSGNPDGVPVLFLHGGPGAGASPVHRRFFDPAFWRIVIFDQRGAGRSAPYAEIRDNTTGHLLGDIEKLRRHLGIERWLVFGGSWGALLALAYGIRHPERCLGFVLRGVFLGRDFELDWFLHGIRTVFPEAWRAFAEYIPQTEQGDLLAAYHRRLTDPDPAVHLPAARAWSRYETRCSYLTPPPGGDDGAAGALALARLEAHYFANRMFLPDNHILANLDRVAALPAAIIQGRYDMICPAITADELAANWPGARYVVVPDAGHSAMEPPIRSALIEAALAMREQIAR